MKSANMVQRLYISSPTFTATITKEFKAALENTDSNFTVANNAKK